MHVGVILMKNKPKRSKKTTTKNKQKTPSKTNKQKQTNKQIKTYCRSLEIYTTLQCLLIRFDCGFVVNFSTILDIWLTHFTEIQFLDSNESSNGISKMHHIYEYFVYSKASQHTFQRLLSGEPDYFGRNKISSGGDRSHYSSASLY